MAAEARRGNVQDRTDAERTGDMAIARKRPTRSAGAPMSCMNAVAVSTDAIGKIGSKPSDRSAAQREYRARRETLVVSDA